MRGYQVAYANHNKDGINLGQFIIKTRHRKLLKSVKAFNVRLTHGYCNVVSDVCACKWDYDSSIMSRKAS